MFKVKLNEAQREALSFYFSPDNHEGEPYPLDEPFEFKEQDGQLYVGGCWLHEDGEWATFPEGPEDPEPTAGGTTYAVRVNATGEIIPADTIADAALCVLDRPLQERIVFAVMDGGARGLSAGEKEALSAEIARLT